MSLPQDDSFNAIVARKRVALEAAASKKKIEISNIALPDTTNTTASGENYAPQGDISSLKKIGLIILSLVISMEKVLMLTQPM